MHLSIHAAFLASLPLAANADVQSVLAPRSVEAEQIAEIGRVMTISAALIFALVLAVLALALHGPPRLRARLSRRGLIVGAGAIFPVLLLSALLFYTLRAGSSGLWRDTEPAARIEVTGEMWWWRVKYLDQQGRTLFETANDIRIPAGVPVEFVLKSDNVIHSFWVPNLAGKLDMVPKHVNRLRVQANEPGLFRGQCAEFCGAQHAKMLFDVHALPVEDFLAWTTAQRQPANEPADARLEAGKKIVMQACAQCHTVRGTAASGTLGPDLTHVGGRSSLGAGLLPNNVGTLAGWLADNQHIKPGNLMPSFDQWSGPDLRLAAHYLESLK